MTQTYTPDWKSLDSRPIPAWFENAKFGIFIHWGVYSVPAWRKLEPGLYASYAEWYYARVMYNKENGGQNFHYNNYGKDFEYRDFGPLFKAELFDPVYWAKLFKRSGAKYVVLTSKHHDGFCLWPTNSPYKKNWNSKDIGPNRDLVGELSEAVRQEGLKMGLYYSIIEWESNWTHRTESGYYLPDFIVEKYKIPEDEYVNHHLMLQLKELVNNYKPVLLFSDGGEWDGSEDYWKTKEFLAWLYNKSPVKNEVVVNDRWAKDMPGNHGDYYSSEYKDMKGTGIDHPWEESRGIGGSYGYNRAENIDDYNSSKELIHELIDIVSRGGNLLLNVGPTSDGRIPVIMQQRLIDIGTWIDINGGAIYNTRPISGKTYTSAEYVRFTKNDDNLFVHCLEWPDINFEISGLDFNKIKDIQLIGSDKKISWEKSERGIVIYSPEISPAEFPNNYAWVFSIEL
jgi:alpha-L-fucosidase